MTDVTRTEVWIGTSHQSTIDITARAVLEAPVLDEVEGDLLCYLYRKMLAEVESRTGTGRRERVRVQLTVKSWVADVELLEADIL